MRASGKRVLVSLALSVVFVLASALPAAANSGKPRIPRDAADWAAFTVAERQAAIGWEYQQLQTALMSGVAIVREVTESGTLALLTIGASPMVTVTYQCTIQWTNLPEGTWTRGGGWTNSTSPMYQIYASQPGTYVGRFYRDGSQIKTWSYLAYNVSRAETYTDYDWKWWFEHPSYFSSGYHGAQQYYGGAWQLGPNQYCSISAQP